MINWWSVFTNSLWVGGLALVLGVFSYTDWRSAQHGKGLRRTIRGVLRQPGFIGGMAMACLGAGLSITQGWTRILWLLLATSLACWASWLWARQRGS
jgi:hypothetical protein